MMHSVAISAGAAPIIAFALLSTKPPSCWRPDMHDSSLASLARDPGPSRRSFLIGASAIGSSLMVGFSTRSDAAPDANKPGANPFVGYVQIAPDDTVTIYSSQMDMGQGIYHGIATLVQEELDADWAKVSVVGGAGNT